jgi:hypothetical protein
MLKTVKLAVLRNDGGKAVRALAKVLARWPFAA